MKSNVLQSETSVMNIKKTINYTEALFVKAADVEKEAHLEHCVERSKSRERGSFVKMNNDYSKVSRDISPNC